MVPGDRREFVFNHAGTDTSEYVEVAGDPATN
jgi:hypothetical protein